MLNEHIVRCNQCQKAHSLILREGQNNKTLSFRCRCGNSINAMYNGSWTLDGAQLSERNEGEPVFIHEPEM